jgi:hypothetical protein
VLKKEEKLNRLKMHPFLAGIEPRQKLKKYNDTASRIKAICNDFENLNTYKRFFKRYCSKFIIIK